MIYAMVRRGVSTSEKCPQCRRVNVDFMDIGGVLGCYDCGCVFVPKKDRVKGKPNPVVEQIVESQTGDPGASDGGGDTGGGIFDGPDVVDEKTSPAFVCDVCGKGKDKN